MIDSCVVCDVQLPGEPYGHCCSPECHKVAVALIRAELKRNIVEEVDGSCECCNEKVGTDLHEVYVKRSAVPKKKQHLIFVRTNCALICRQCHDGLALTEWFKGRFESRLCALGYDGRYKFPRGNI